MAKSASANMTQDQLFLSTIIGIHDLMESNVRVLGDPIREAIIQLAEQLVIKEWRGGRC